MPALTAIALTTLAIVAQDATPLRAAPSASAANHAQLWQGELLEVRGSRLDQIGEVRGGPGPSQRPDDWCGEHHVADQAQPHQQDAHGGDYRPQSGTHTIISPCSLLPCWP